MFLYTSEITIIGDCFVFQELFLGQNNIDFIHPFAFKGLKILHKLDISSNKLTSVPPLVDVKSTLQKLSLSRNYIKHIEDSYFDLCLNIKYIHIGFNKLTKFPSMQNIAKTIVVFEVEYNNISNANFIYGNNFPKLESLRLESNQIREFCPPPGDFAPRLHSLYLQINKLSMIHFPYESHRQELFVFLDNNRWHCDGFLGWIQECEIKYEMHDDIKCMGWLHLHEMICDSPLEARGLTPKEAGNRGCKYE